jgi:hypothetical protein
MAAATKRKNSASSPHYDESPSVITSRILISIGDHMTRKKDVVEKIFRQELTAEVIRRLERKRERKREKEWNPNCPGESSLSNSTGLETPEVG